MGYYGHPPNDGQESRQQYQQYDGPYQGPSQTGEKLRTETTPPKQKSRLWLWILLAVIVLVIVGLLIAGAIIVTLYAATIVKILYIGGFVALLIAVIVLNHQKGKHFGLGILLLLVGIILVLACGAYIIGPEKDLTFAIGFGAIGIVIVICIAAVLHRD